MLVTRVERLEALAPGTGDVYRVLAFDVEATVDAPVDPATGMVVNLTAMKEVLRTEVTRRLAGRMLDGREGRPDGRTPELLARALWRALGGKLAGAPLARVRLVGRPSPVVECRGEGEMDVTRVYEFSASHRLHSPNLSDEENRRIFGKCNHPSGHGHNYVLEVTIRGQPSGSGEVFPPAELDRIVGQTILERWDHRHLNEDLAEFEGVNPTAEQIARVAWTRLAGSLPGGDARLHRIKLRETDRNHVEYFGD